MRFTDKGVKALKPKAKRYEVWEGGGFGMRVTPRGSKSWIWVYHFQRRPRRLTLGTFPAIGLADARLRLAEAQKALKNGNDPGVDIVAERRAERAAETIAELVALYLEKWARPRKRSAFEDERIFRKDVLPKWGARKAKDVHRRDVVALLDSIVERGAPVQANRTLACIRKLFNWAISRDILETNPCHMVEAPGVESRRDRVLSESEIAGFWNGLEEARISDTIRLALKFQLITAQRKGEVIRAEWSEFQDGAWTIPAEKSQNRLPHRVPLSDLALGLLDNIKVKAATSRWLFPSPHGDKPIAGQSVDHAVRNSRQTLGIDDVTPHDLRRTAASHMTRMGVSRSTVGKILNHAEPGVTAISDRHSHDDEKRQALEGWARRLQELVHGLEMQEFDTVVALQRGRRP